MSACLIAVALIVGQPDATQPSPNAGADKAQFERWQKYYSASAVLSSGGGREPGQFLPPFECDEFAICRDAGKTLLEARGPAN